MHSPYYSQQHSRKTSSSKTNTSFQKIKNFSDLYNNLNSTPKNIPKNNNKNQTNTEINNFINKRNNNIPSNIITYKTISNTNSKNNLINNSNIIRINKGNRSPFRTLQNTPKSSVINTPNSLHRHPSYNRTINSTIYSNLIKNNIENSPSILSPNNNKIINSNHFINNSNLQLSKKLNYYNNDKYKTEEKNLNDKLNNLLNYINIIKEKISKTEIDTKNVIEDYNKINKKINEIMLKKIFQQNKVKQ